MRYRPFRSLSFWFGIPGLIFLLWAWVDSMHYDSKVSYKAGCRLSDGTLTSRYTSASNSGANVALSWTRPDVSYKLLSHHFDSTKRDPREQTSWLPLPSYHANRSYPGIIYYNLSIPHWFLILSYGFLWIVGILFQWLVVKRIKAGQRALEAEAGKA
ncbi:hypothetical protein [Luteolibacter luteus]|uniref:Uncharacterized protein n=1 Tax=Luteolibacter luteus TaxID=2728835 RepID=A0A858RBL0_9BACT|nr:hypothetical protein [Luteolibacter luteus]QJE94386.1 hypothetical protein HHL09_00825 [Luteolibacter luteus]